MNEYQVHVDRVWKALEAYKVNSNGQTLSKLRRTVTNAKKISQFMSYDIERVFADQNMSISILEA